MPRLAVLCLSLALAGSASSETIHVLALESEPFFYEQDGEPAGIEYEILQYFAKTRGAELEIEYVSSFSDLLAKIEAGDADIAAGTITVTREREGRMVFSTGYFPVQVVLVERTGQTSASLSDLAGFSVAAFSETTATDILQDVAGVEIVQREGVSGMLDAVASEEIRGAAADSSSVIPLLDDYPSLEISLELGEEQYFGFAMPQGSSLKNALSEHVLNLKESGIYFRVVTKYMGPRASAIVRAAR